MSGPNPFSLSNAPEHNLIPKVISVLGNGVHYEVAVDLVDIDTAYMRQIGSTGRQVQIEYVTQLGSTGFPVSQEYVTNLGSTGYPVTQEYVTNLGSTGYPVTQAYIAQLGNTGASGNAYFNDIHVGGTLYWHHFSPDIIGGSGGSGGYIPVGGTGIHVDLDGTTATIYSNLVAGPGIGLTLTSNNWNIQNTGILGITGGTYVNVNYANPQYPVISFSGVTGVQSISGGTGISVNSSNPQNPVISYTGITGIAAGANVFIDFTTNPLVPIISTGGGTGGLPSGPTGELIYFTSTGIDASPNLVYNPVTTILTAPDVEARSLTIQTAGQTGRMIQETFGNDSIIASGNSSSVGSGNLVNIGPIGTGTTGIYPAVVVDTLNYRMGVNKNPSVAFDVLGQTLLTGTTVENGVTGGTGITGSITLASGSTYALYAWGAGGTGNGGTGGAGGFSQVTLVTGPAPNVLSWSQQFGGASGGGNALVASYAGVTFLWVPGGGAGNTNGSGAAAGEVQGSPLTEGGISAPGIVGATATFTIGQPWSFTTLTGATLPPGESFPGGTIGGTFGTVGSTGGMTFTFDFGGGPSPITQTISSAGTTYNVPSGITLTVQANIISFAGSTFLSLPNSNSTIPNGSYISVDGGTGTTLAGNGTAVYTSWPGVTLPGIFNGAQIDTGPTGISSPAGTVTWISGSVVFPAVGTSRSWFFSGNITEAPANEVIILTGTSSVKFPVNIPTISSGSITTSAIEVIPAGSKIVVSNRQLNSPGQAATGSTGAAYGGGGFTGGGAPALITTLPYGATGTLGVTGNLPAGGGAGSWNIISAGVGDALVQLDYNIGGQGPNPFTNSYNPGGVYGAGGNPGFLVINKVIQAPNALTVNGDELIDGGDLEVNNGNIYTNQGIRGRFVSACAQGTAPAGGVINGIPTQSGGKMMWNELAAGQGRTEFLNARGSQPASVGFAWYAGPDGSTAQPPVGTAVNLGYLDLAGLVITGTVTGSDIIASSDIRLKNDIQTIDSALDKVMRMRGVYFTKKDQEGRYTGVIAQEVEDVLPEVVYTDDTEDKMKSVSYGSIVGLLIEAIKEQQKMINTLTEKTT